MNMQIRNTTRSARYALLLSLLLAPALTTTAQAQASKVPHPPSAAQPAPAAAAGPQGVINLNTASIEELTRLPGVGQSRAAAIVELRTKLHGFKAVEDILRVKGIGRKSFHKLEPMLRLQGTTTLTEARKVKSASKGDKSE